MAESPEHRCPTAQEVWDGPGQPEGTEAALRPDRCSTRGQGLTRASSQDSSAPGAPTAWKGALPKPPRATEATAVTAQGRNRRPGVASVLFYLITHPKIPPIAKFLFPPRRNCNDWGFFFFPPLLFFFFPFFVLFCCFSAGVGRAGGGWLTVAAAAARTVPRAGR